MTAMSPELGQPARDGRLATTDEAAEHAVNREPARAAEPGAPPAGTGQAAEPAGDADGPLLGDASGLRASWQRIQSGFVDDPREAVADAADLVEHTAQALAGALRQRQQRLRAMWTGSGEAPPGAGQRNAGDIADTERLRLLMRRYRVLFDHICPP